MNRVKGLCFGRTAGLDQRGSNSFKDLEEGASIEIWVGFPRSECMALLSFMLLCQIQGYVERSLSFVGDLSLQVSTLHNSHKWLRQRRVSTFPESSA